MSHDVKKNKFLKKIIGAIGYKLFDKNSVKTERIVDQISYNAGDFLKILIKKKKIKKIIQVGANDGQSDDFLSKSFTQDLQAILIEPIEDAFNNLKKNYKIFPKVQCLNIAVDIKSDKKNIYSVNPKYYSYYKDKYQQKSVDWLTVLSSFSREHLKKHGVQEKHIIAKSIECKTFNQIINTYNYHDLDLLIVDTEGYDYTLVNNFIEIVKIKPMIIFEWIHCNEKEIKKLLLKLKSNNYNFFKTGRDLICMQNNYLF